MQARTMLERYQLAVKRNSFLSVFLQQLAEGQTIDDISNSRVMENLNRFLTLQDAEDIAAIITDDNCVENFSLDLIFNAIDAPITATLANALMTGKTKRGLALDFAKSNLTNHDINELAAAIRSGMLPENMHLTLSGSEHIEGNDSWKYLFTTIAEGNLMALKNGRSYKNFTLKLIHAVDAELISFFSEELASGSYPEGFTLNVSHNRYDKKSLLKFADAAKLQTYPKQLQLILDDRGDNDDYRTHTTITFEQELEKCGRSDISYKLAGDLRTEGVAAIAHRILSGNCKPGSHFSLTDAVITDDKIALIADVIKHTNCPDNLSFDLALNHIEEPGYNLLIDSFKQCKAKNLVMDFGNIGFSHFPKACIIALINALQSENFIHGLHLSFPLGSFSNNGIKEKFLDVITEEKCPNGLQIDLGLHDIDEKTLSIITKRMMKQTLLCELTTKVFSDTTIDDIPTYNMNRKRLSLCCQRNKLIYNHPEFASQIKMIAADYDMYQPGSPANIRHLPIHLFDNERVKLPKDILLWQRQLQLFKEKFTLVTQSVSNLK